MRQSIAIDVGVESAIRELWEGLEPYQYEQSRLLRLLRFKGGGFSADDFDRWFQHPRRIRSRRGCRHFAPTTPLLLGFSGGQFSEWALNLEILQALAHLGQVSVMEAREGGIFYQLVEALEAG
jgi:hypothetical protein